MTARATAERHAPDVTDGNLPRLMEGVRYSNDTDQLELETTWQTFEGGVWKIVKARKAGE